MFGFFWSSYSPSFLSVTDSKGLVGSTTAGFIGVCLAIGFEVSTDTSFIAVTVG